MVTRVAEALACENSISLPCRAGAANDNRLIWVQSVTALLLESRASGDLQLGATFCLSACQCCNLVVIWGALESVTRMTGAVLKLVDTPNC